MVFIQCGIELMVTLPTKLCIKKYIVFVKMLGNVNFEGQFFCNANINFLIFVVLFLRIILLSIFVDFVSTFFLSNMLH